MIRPNLLYYAPSRRLDPRLEPLVREHLLSNELIYQWTSSVEDGLILVLLIDEDDLRDNEQVAIVMGGLCIGGGRTLAFRDNGTTWCYVEEGEWIS